MPRLEVKILVFRTRNRNNKKSKVSTSVTRRAQYNDNEIMNFHQHSNRIKSDVVVVVLCVFALQFHQCIIYCDFSSKTLLCSFLPHLLCTQCQNLARKKIRFYGCNQWLMDAIRCSFNYHSYAMKMSANEDETEHMPTSKYVSRTLREPTPSKSINTYTYVLFSEQCSHYRRKIFTMNPPELNSLGLNAINIDLGNNLLTLQCWKVVLYHQIYFMIS